MGESAHVYGWGTTEFGGDASPELLEVAVAVVSHEVCFQVMQPEQITAAMLCAGGEEGKDSCQV